MILSKQKTVFALSLFVCMNIHAKTNNETDNSSNQITELSAIEVKALAEPAGGGGLN